MRSNSRENVTVVVTISAAGATLAPWIIYNGQRLQADWVKGRNGPPNARLAVTDSSFMQGIVLVNYIRDFHRQLLDRGLINGTPHVLVLDGHASHVTYEVVKLARNLNIVRYQIPSHSSHVVQPLDVKVGEGVVANATGRGAGRGRVVGRVVRNAGVCRSGRTLTPARVVDV
ncbi:unnamed protein product [Ectocarpus sp. CCAP 1310/34]|nr:unnamed protein product [Ectocarpus sp. CCAP 1310/34]